MSPLRFYVRSIRISIRLHRYCATNFCRRVFSLAGEIEDERSDLEWHLLIFGQRAHGLVLEHLQLIVPWFDLDPSAKRQRSDDVAHRLFCRWLRAGHRGSDRPACRDPVAQMRADQIGDLLRTFI